MAYPHDQFGVPLRIVPGMRPLDIEKEIPERGDIWIGIGDYANKPYSQSDVMTRGLNCLIDIEKHKQTLMGLAIYRKVEPSWQRLSETEILKAGDILSIFDSEDKLPPTTDYEIPAAFDLEYKCIRCEKGGYGNGSYSLANFLGGIRGYKSAWRLINGDVVPSGAAKPIVKRTRVRKNENLSEPLPLP